MAVNGRSKSAERYIRTSRQFIVQAQEEFDRGDMLQASEKAWGAAAQAVKATAEQRGWEHNNHARLFENVKKVSQETGDPELHDLFHVANSLHQNFYEGWQTDDSVRRGILRVKILVDRLTALVTEE